jgi:hypothetical protein
VIAIVRSDLMTIKKPAELGMGDRDRLGTGEGNLIPF